MGICHNLIITWIEVIFKVDCCNQFDGITGLSNIFYKEYDRRKEGAFRLLIFKYL